jgi:hypothetical protein
MTAYVEGYSALGWRLILATVLSSAVLVTSVILITVVSVGFISLAVISLLFSLYYAIVLFGRARPVGIQVDATGIRIGGISRASLHPSPQTRLPHARWHYRQVFACPWDGVHRVEVVTDRTELRKYAKLGRITGDPPRVRLGMLTVPFMRAALVATVDLRMADVPRFRPPDDRRYWFKMSDPAQADLSPIWVAPTRRPERLRTALAQVNAPGLVLRHHHGDRR